jgi:hypothetical protein
VLALGQAIDDQRSPSTSLSIDEHRHSSHVCCDQKRSGLRHLRLQRNWDGQDLAAHQVDPLRKGREPALADLQQVPARGERLAQRYVAGRFAIDANRCARRGIVARGDHEDGSGRVLRKRRRRDEEQTQHQHDPHEPTNAKQPLHNPSDAPKSGRFTHGPRASLVFTPSPEVGLINDRQRLR